MRTPRAYVLVVMLRVTVLSIALALLLASAQSAVAAGDGGGDGTNDLFSRFRQIKPVDPDYTAAVKAIKARDFAVAIRLLEGVVTRDGKNPDAYNWLGYATRKNGDPARAIPFYEKALGIDPKHRGAREYLGEAYLQLGDLPKAKEQLAALSKLCFFPCEEYSDLKKAVQAYERSRGRITPTATGRLER